nr:uncharacterized protein LOC131785162 [Pocillopora verrucosa]
MAITWIKRKILESRALQREQDEVFHAAQEADASKRNQQQGAARPTFQPTERKDRELSLPENDMAEEIRNLRENRMRKGPKDGVKIKVYTPSGLFKRTFHRGGCYQEVYDWLGSSQMQPLFFSLETQENRTVFPTEAIKPPGEVLRLVEKSEQEMEKLMSESPEKVSFKGTGPLQTDKDLNSTIGTRADDSNKSIGKKVKKMKKRIKELDKKATKGESKDTDDKKRKRKRKPEDNNKSNLNAKKMKAKEDDIEMNKISRRQMRRLRAKEKKKSKTNK